MADDDFTSEQMVGILTDSLKASQAFIDFIAREEPKPALPQGRAHPARDDRDDLGRSGDFAGDILQTIGRMLEKHPDRAQAIAFSLRDGYLTGELGHLAWGRIAVDEKRLGFARAAFDRCSDDIICRYALGMALEAYAGTRHERTVRLLDVAAGDPRAYLSNKSPLELYTVAGFAACIGHDAAFDAVTGLLDGRDTDPRTDAKLFALKTVYAQQKALAAQLDLPNDYRLLFERLLGEAAAPETDAIKVGILAYENPTQGSSNVGDFVQTIGVIGQLGRYRYDALTADPAVRDILDASEKDRGTVETAVEILPVNRDFSITAAAKGRIWLPVCGWFAHNTYFTDFTFPFAGNILPIFLSFHVARPEMLSTEAIGYLKRHAPIGCRDVMTARLLRDAGIKAFVNGCVTLTINRTLPEFKGGRHGRYYAAHGKAPATLEADETFVGHTDVGIFKQPFSANLRRSWETLKTYHQAERVRTPLLHCFLPCRSMDTPVEFTHKNLSDPRFEGLVDLDREEQRDVAARFEQKFAAVFDAIFAGRSPEDVYAVWRQCTEDEMRRTDALLKAGETPRRSHDIELKAGIENVQPRIFGEARGEGETVDLLFCFDDDREWQFKATLQAIAGKTSRPLRIHIASRHTKINYVEALSQRFGDCGFLHYDLTDIRHAGVSLPRGTSASSLDWLLAPLMLKAAKVLCLDTDILVRGDIGALFDTGLGSRAIGARPDGERGTRFVYDLAEHMAPELARRFRQATFDDGMVGFPTFAAGVVLFDLDKLRGDHFAERTVDLVERFGITADQAANIHARGDYVPLPAEWNHDPAMETIADPKLVHFAGRLKPWSRHAYHPYAAEWLRGRAAASPAALAENDEDAS